MRDLVKQCAKATGWSQSATMNEVNLFCEIVGLPKNFHNNLIGNDPHGVVDFQEGYMFFNMSDIHVVVSEYEHWLKIYGDNKAIGKAVREWYYWSLDWCEKHPRMEWVDARKNEPIEGETFLGWFDGVYKVCRVIGEEMFECDGFLTGENNWSSMKALSDDVALYLKNYMPLRKPDRTYCPNLRSWLLGCPIPGLREATAEYKENYDKALAKAKANRDASYKALKEAIEQKSKEAKGGEV